MNTRLSILDQELPCGLVVEGILDVVENELDDHKVKDFSGFDLNDAYSPIAGA